jgi:serine/threonine-protein kinase
MAAGGLFAVLGAAAAAALFWLLAPTSPEGPVRRFEIPASGPHISGVQARMVSISPDGAKLAFVDDGLLRIRWLDKLETRDVVTQADPAIIFWSPDSAWLGWGGGGKLWKAPAEGGESTVIADQPGILAGGTGASWGPDGRIALTRGDGPMFEVSERGGDLQVILENDSAVESDFHEPYYLPDGNLLFTAHKQGGRPDTLSVLVNGERKDLLTIEGQDIWRVVYSKTGHILYRRHPTNPGIWALPFSLSGHEITGEPFLVVPDGDVPSISDDGTLIHVLGAVTRATQMVWVDREGNVLEPIGQPQEQWPFPALSPDGRSIAIAATENEAREVWIHDIQRGTKTRLTFGATQPGTTSWSTDGRAIAFEEGSSPPFAMSLQAADGSGEKQGIGEGFGGAFSPDGEYFVFANLNAETSFDLYYRDAGFEGDPVPVVQDEGMQLWGRVSPDGKYITYASDETGQPEVYVKRFPGGEGKWQVSLGGGFWPQWSDKGERIYYVIGETIMEVDVSTGESLQLGNAREVFTRQPLGWPLPLGFPPGFDVSPDDQRFIICQSVNEEQDSMGIIVVENWFEDYRPVE